jgi:hypothetical protein
VKHVKELVEWVNSQAEVTGGEKVEGHSKSWLEENEVKMLKITKMLEAKAALQRREFESLR